jgi:hypothetical protein
MPVGHDRESLRRGLHRRLKPGGLQRNCGQKGQNK